MCFLVANTSCRVCFSGLPRMLFSSKYKLPRMLFRGCVFFSSVTIKIFQCYHQIFPWLPQTFPWLPPGVIKQVRTESQPPRRPTLQCPFGRSFLERPGCLVLGCKVCSCCDIRFANRTPLCRRKSLANIG